MDFRKFIMSFNNLNTYLFLSVIALIAIVVYFYVINP